MASVYTSRAHLLPPVQEQLSKTSILKYSGSFLSIMGKKGTTGIEPVTIGSAIQCSTAELCTRKCGNWTETSTDKVSREPKGDRTQFEREGTGCLFFVITVEPPSKYRAEAQHTRRRLFRGSKKGTFAHLHTTLNKSRDEKLFHTWTEVLYVSLHSKGDRTL